MNKEEILKSFKALCEEDRATVLSELAGLQKTRSSAEACCPPEMKSHMMDMMKKMGDSSDPMACCQAMMSMCQTMMKEKTG